MFSFLKKKKDEDIETKELPLEVKENSIEELESQNEQKKGFFSKALEKNF